MSVSTSMEKSTPSRRKENEAPSWRVAVGFRDRHTFWSIDGGSMVERTSKPKFNWKLVRKTLLSPLLPALAGYGMFWWYMQPFSDLRMYPGVAIMIACYIAAIGGFYVGK